MIETITSNTTTGEKLRGRGVNPMATARLKDFFAQLYNQDVTGAGMADKDYHIHVAAGEGVKEEMEKLPRLQLYEADDSEALNLFDLLGKGAWIPTEHWVSCVHSPSSLRVDGWFGLQGDVLG